MTITVCLITIRLGCTQPLIDKHTVVRPPFLAPRDSTRTLAKPSRERMATGSFRPPNCWSSGADKSDPPSTATSTPDLLSAESLVIPIDRPGHLDWCIAQVKDLVVVYLGSLADQL
jgi:hypothetical protein